MSRNLKELIRQMTLEEKAGLCSGADFWNTMGIERLGIPSVMMTDGPHGLRKQEGAADHLGLNKSVNAVCFPAACATASSFDVELMERRRPDDIFQADERYRHVLNRKLGSA